MMAPIDWQNPYVVAFAVLLLAKFAVEAFLDVLNEQEVNRNKDKRPPWAEATMDAETYRKAVAYTLAKIRFGRVEHLWGTAILAFFVLSGALAGLFHGFESLLGNSLWWQPLVLMAVVFVMSLPSLPFEWYDQFRVEEKHGFNNSTVGLWISDKVKGIGVNLVIMYPILLLLFWLVGKENWWVWAFVAFFLFQLLMAVLYPMVIMPLFNKFEPLEEGGLRDRLMSLADRLGFAAKTILVMDGSRRSAHSNAYFAGFGKFRRIVIYDTLMKELREEELEAVLAHEIGHYKKGHILRMLAVFAVVFFVGFWFLGVVSTDLSFVAGFGFRELSPPAVLLMFLPFSGLVGFWLSPFFNVFVRRHEYEADAFAKKAHGDPEPLVNALRKLSKQNLSNLTPHRFYSWFHYSHPTLPEREAALRAET